MHKSALYIAHHFVWAAVISSIKTSQLCAQFGRTVADASLFFGMDCDRRRRAPRGKKSHSSQGLWSEAVLHFQCSVLLSLICLLVMPLICVFHFYNGKVIQSLVASVVRHIADLRQLLRMSSNSYHVSYDVTDYLLHPFENIEH